ncbi:MAG: hypothetical protein JNL10_03750 [Verrucomicrobiales bacterium]|nr:hypothetical protein [Verrucomicrobiales bacterium]
MRTTVELPDDLFRQAKARAALQGQSLKDLVAAGLQLVLQQSVDASPSPESARRPELPVVKARDRVRRVTPAMFAEAAEPFITAAVPAVLPPARKRASAGAWAKQFAGIAGPPPGVSTDEARMAHYRRKYGV